MRTFILMVLSATALSAQSAPAAGLRWDVTAGTGSGATSASAGVVKFYPVAAERVQLGLGVRATYVGGDLRLSPAGANNIPAGVLDTLSVSSGALMLNISGHATVVLTSRLQAGLNIDLAGFGTGATQTASYRASATTAPISVRASPSGANLFLYGSKDRGSLNSEFFGAWALNDRFTLRGGLSHQLVEYEAERSLTSNTRRFRSYSNLFFLGLRIGR